jgi:putative hemolysin
MRQLVGLIFFLAALTGLLGSCSAEETPTTPTGPAIANPASENCVKQGGTLVIQTRGELGEYGVCVFDDNRQCEEWTLLHGDCPTTGVDISGYATTAAIYCAITGGEYAVRGDAGAADEQGTCTFKTGQTCDVRAYFDGKCDSQEEDETK